MKIFLTAIIKSKIKNINEVKAILLNMVSESSKESACLQYDLHQDATAENIFVFYEIWENQEGLDLHNQKVYIKEFVSIIDTKLQEKPQIFKMKKI